jgi:gluconolactonase
MSAPRELAAGIGFTEGPLWTADGRLLVTSLSRGLVYEVGLDGGAEVLVETGGGPNGLAQDASGTVWVAQNGGATTKSKSERPVRAGLQTLGDGAVADVLGEGCDAPNDLVLGPDGRIWFTDPPSPFDDSPGRVCAYEPASGALTVLLEGLEYPNGLAFGPDGRFYVAETRRTRVLRYAYEDGTLGAPEEFAALREGRPDGIAFDTEGNLYVAATSADAVLVYDPDGAELEPIAFGGPSMPTNVAFAGPALDVLVVTLGKGGRVYAVDGVATGMDLVGTATR